jgi:hypothetical protein
MKLENMTNQELATFLRAISAYTSSTSFTKETIDLMADRLDALTPPATSTSEVTPEAQEYIDAKEDPAPEQPAVEQTQVINRQDLKDLCMSLVRTNPDMKPIIKNIISGYGATTIDKVVEADLPALKSKLESL